MTLFVTVVHFAPPQSVDAQQGALGKVDLLISGLYVRSVRVRRSPEGHEYLSFPAQFDRRGRRWFPVQPHDDATRTEIERQVFAQLRREGRLAS